jgi:hypothetical protein
LQAVALLGFAVGFPAGALWALDLSGKSMAHTYRRELERNIHWKSMANLKNTIHWENDGDGSHTYQRKKSNISVREKQTQWKPGMISHHASSLGFLSSDSLGTCHINVYIKMLVNMVTMMHYLFKHAGKCLFI